MAASEVLHSCACPSFSNNVAHLNSDIHSRQSAYSRCFNELGLRRRQGFHRVDGLQALRWKQTAVVHPCKFKVILRREIQTAKTDLLSTGSNDSDSESDIDGAFNLEREGESSDEEDNLSKLETNKLARLAHKRALKAVKQRKSKLARELFEKAIARFPGNARILTSAAIFEQKRFRFGASRELFRKAVQADPQNAIALQAWALMEIRAKGPDWRQCVRQFFQKATSVDPSHAPAWQAWAVFEWKQGRAPSARALFVKATNADPSHAPSWQAWAIAESKAGQSETARALFEKALEADPQHLPAILAWARMEWGLGELAKGRELYDQGVKCAGKSSMGLLHDWAKNESRSKHFGRARQLYRKAADLYPSAPQAWLLWGKHEQAQQKFDKARELFTKGLQASQGENEIMSHTLAMLEKEVGNSDTAQRILAELVLRNKSNAHAWHSLADLCVRKGPPKWDRARECYRNAVELGPSQDREGKAGTYVAWAQLEAMAGQNETARALFQRAVELAPGDAEHLRKWAQFEKKAGEETDVRKIFQKSIEAGPTSRTYLSWGQWEKRVGNSEGALECFQNGIQNDAENPFNYMALAAMHLDAGRLDEARDVYKSGTASCPTYAPLWMEWALLEARKVGGEGLQRSRWLFARGSRLEPPHIPLLEAWATVEEGFGEGRVASKLRARVGEMEARRQGKRSEEAAEPVEIKSDEFSGSVQSDANDERRAVGNTEVDVAEDRGLSRAAKQAGRTRKVDKLIESLLGVT